MADASGKTPQAPRSRPTVRKQATPRSRSGSALSPAHRGRWFALAGAAACLLLVAVAAVLLSNGADSPAASISGQPRIAQGVFVGSVDLSGKSEAEAVSAIEAAYGPSLKSASAVVCGSEEALDAVPSASGEGQPAQGSIAAEQMEASSSGSPDDLTWTVTPADLGGCVDAASLARDALVASGYTADEATGTWQGSSAVANAGDRGKVVLQPYCAFDPELLEEFAESLDESLGTGCVETSVVVSDGGARAVEGAPGTRVDRGMLSLELSFAFLDIYGTNAFVVSVEDASPSVSLADAQQVADEVTRALHGGAVFTCEGASWKAGASQLGDWVDVVLAADSSGKAYLRPVVDEEAMAPALIANLAPGSEAAAVSFSVADDGSVGVSVRGATHYPNAQHAAELLQETLFGQNGKAYSADGSQQAEDPAQVEVEAQDAPENLTFDEAVAAGLVQRISTFTTEFSTVPGTENRNHNIALACELLNNSVAKADGGRWSFNETAGNCNAERGFLDAGAIVDNEYVAEVGGGICQVATTVFNAVYEAGYPVVSRSNHSLYIASYPIGRDAAVSWPDLDFVWANDADSDVLLRAESGTGYLTVSLYGVSPRYSVSTETGDWQEGQKHETRRERDDTLAPGTSYVKTYGSDGSRVSVIRTVYAADGSMVRQDNFVSSYAPITEVVVEGPDAPDEPKDAGSSGEGAAQNGDASGAQPSSSSSDGQSQPDDAQNVSG